MVHQENIAPEPVLTRKKAKAIAEKIDDQGDNESDAESIPDSEDNFLWDKPKIDRNPPRRITRSMKPPPLPPKNIKTPPAEPKKKGNFFSRTQNFFNKFV